MNHGLAPEDHCLCLGELPELSTSLAHCTCITPRWLREPKIPNPCVSHYLPCSQLHCKARASLAISFHPRLTSCLGSGMSKAFQTPRPHQGWPAPASGGNPLPMRYTEAGQAVTCSHGHHRKPRSCTGLALTRINVPFLARTGSVWGE